MKQIRIIGDSHGQDKKYLECAKQSEYSICVGDVGFDYSFLDKLDFTKHIFIPGNHDNYDKLPDCEHALEGWGTYELNKIPFFFIRGGFSIDWKYRMKHEMSTGQKIWWEDEQLSIPRLQNAVAVYEDVKPDLMITHECPTEVAKRIGNPDILRDYGYNPKTFTTNTQECLQACFLEHQPKLWIFGHFHNNIDLTVNNTRFICLNMIPRYKYFIDINENLEIL